MRGPSTSYDVSRPKGTYVTVKCTTLFFFIFLHLSSNFFLPLFLFSYPSTLLYFYLFSPFISSPLNSFFLLTIVFTVDFGKSMCPSSPSLSAQGSIGVDFGYDVTSGCMLSLNRLERS